MTTTILIPAGEREKFDAVLEIYNKKRPLKITVIESEGSNIVLEHETAFQLFILGRMFEPYKPANKSGSMEINFDNSYLNKF